MSELFLKKPIISVIIPARNEANNLKSLLPKIKAVLERSFVPYEIIIVNDHSIDGTLDVISEISLEDDRVKIVDNNLQGGYGFSIRKGLDKFNGEYVVIVMADGSEDPEDIVKYYNKMCEGYECVFGTRFCRSAKVINYPLYKLVLNRFGNFFIKILFLVPYNDFTNAFKCYHRDVISGMAPLIAGQFNLTVEMPLKAIIRGYKWSVVPINWYGRKRGLSKWKLKELSLGYLFIISYLWLEKVLVRGNYNR